MPPIQKFLKADFILGQLIDHFKDRPFFTRVELFDFYHQFEPDLKKTAFEGRVYHLRAKKLISSVDRKRFSLSYKPRFTPVLEPRQKDVFSKVEKQFPDVSFCIWSTKWMNEFMLHQPGRFMNVLEVGDEAAETVFHFLQDNNIRNLFFQPGAKEIENYISENFDSVVVKYLVTKAPLEIASNIRIPSIEKILVDIFADKVLYLVFQGSELSFIFNSVYQKYEINFTKLFHYAKRRGKSEELSAFLRINTDIPKNVLND
ncbi:MAG: DUF6577 family protein [Bacteroidota bacterium]